MQNNMLRHLVVLLCAAAAIHAGCSEAASTSDVDTFSFPVFNATTTRTLNVVTNSPVTSASLLLDPDPAFAAFNRSEGFLLLEQGINVWRAGGAGGRVPAREASFNSSFTLAGSSPVAFVVLKGSLPTLNSPDGLRGPAAATAGPAPTFVGSLATVEVGAVRSYGRDDPAVGLNVTVTPNGTAPTSRTVWVEYDAGAHHVSVYVAAAGQPRPVKAVLDEALNLAGRRTTDTETAYVGFFPGAISDVIVGVRDWELTVDVLPDKNDGNRMKKTSWVNGR